MKYYMVFVCIALASLNFKSNCFPSRQTTTDNPCQDQPNGSFFDHPLGCKYFIVCNNGELNVGSCPDGLAFNPLRPPCDLEANVDCSAYTTTETTTQSTTTELTTTTLSTTTATIPTTVSTTTRSTTTTTTPSESTTTNRPTTSNTPTTTQRPTTVIITTTQRPTTTTQRPTTTTQRPTTTTRQPTTTTVRPVTPEMPVPPEIIKCPDEDPNKLVFLASNIHCSKYYICYHDKPIEMTCSPNLHWNIKTQKCDTIEEAQCTVSTMPSFFPVCPRDAIGIYPHPLNCEWFLYCYLGHMTVQQCPFFYNWDRETQSCQLKSVARCILYSE